MARAAGALTAAITGKMSGDGIRGADYHIETCEQEIPFAYTKSYTTALAALALLTIRIAEQKTKTALSARLADLSRVPELMREAIGRRNL